MSLTWKEKLAGDMPPAWEAEIDHFEAQMLLPTCKAGENRRKSIRGVAAAAPGHMASGL